MLSYSVPLILASSHARASEGLNLDPDIPSMVGQIAALILLIPIVHSLLLKPVAAVLAEREQKTQGASEVAGDLTEEATRLASDLEARLRQARADAHSARTELLAQAEHTERAILETAREQAAEVVAKVRSAVQSDCVAAQAEIEGDARQLAREAAGKLLGRSL